MSPGCLKLHLIFVPRHVSLLESISIVKLLDVTHESRIITGRDEFDC